MIGTGMRTLAQAVRFLHPPDAIHYDAPTDCRIDDPHGFDGAPSASADVVLEM